MTLKKRFFSCIFLFFVCSCVINIILKDDGGSTPLHWAAGEGHVETVENLIEKSANVNTRDNNNETPLHFAYGLYEVLVKKGLIVCVLTLGV